MIINSKILRHKFLSYFFKKNHTIIKSSPLVLKQEVSLLFVNAGMVQFKNMFLNKEKIFNNRIVSIQKCLRISGKHNDFENVGKTTRHHVFFEMLGNFSFGSYFKKNACIYAWNFLTEVIGLNKKKLSVTIFKGDAEFKADIETGYIWNKEIGLDKKKIFWLGRKDNFWSMGNTGPCGPCTEIYYKRDEVKKTFGEVEDINIEIWNLVFMQYIKKEDGSIDKLEIPCVDTGMGLERLLSIINQKSSNYDTDLFQIYIDYFTINESIFYKKTNSLKDISIRVISDHIRAIVFLIAEGIYPNNTGRGYILRRVIRRTIEQCKRIEIKEEKLNELSKLVIKKMNPFYSNIIKSEDIIKKTLNQEIEIFKHTINKGIKVFNEKITKLKKGKKLDGKFVFTLYETYGVPPNLVAVLSKRNKININWISLNEAKLFHKNISKDSFTKIIEEDILFDKFIVLKKKYYFLGYNKDSLKSSISMILLNKAVVKKVKKGDFCSFFLDKTVFYGESGGQVGDIGLFYRYNFQGDVLDSNKINNVIIHKVMVLKGVCLFKDKVNIQINIERRKLIQINHTTTHLLHHILKKHFGSHIVQKGSLIEEIRLRFDFTHYKSLNKKDIKYIEYMINNWIKRYGEIKVKNMTLNNIKKKGITGLFGESYGEEVRLIKIDGGSRELCGGTHLLSTGMIDEVKIISSEPLSSGVRRIELITGNNIGVLNKKKNNLIKKISDFLNIDETDLYKEIDGEFNKILLDRSNLNEYINKEEDQKINMLINSRKTYKDFYFLSKKLSDKFSSKDLRVYAQKLNKNLEKTISILWRKGKDNICFFLISVSIDLINKYKANDIIKKINNEFKSKGGGDKIISQGGGIKENEINKVNENIINYLN